MAIISGQVEKVSYVESSPHLGLPGRRIGLALRGEIYAPAKLDKDGHIITEFFTLYVLDLPSSRKLLNPDALMGHDVRLSEVSDDAGIFQPNDRQRLVEMVSAIPAACMELNESSAWA
jgi:hypothetical protein